MGMMFGIMDSLFPIFFSIIFFIVVGGFVFAAVNGIKTYTKNNASPVLTVTAVVVDKRESHSVHHHGTTDAAAHHTSSSTSYYCTFEVESGDRMEFYVPSREYGLMVRGDMGQLTFQGTRFKDFVRNTRV